MGFNENTRVKIPAILHLCRLGYKYISLKNCDWDKSTNIFSEIFKESIGKINSDFESEDIERKLEELKLVLDYEDLGKEFYNKLTATSGIKLLDFETFENNSFHVVTELDRKSVV